MAVEPAVNSITCPQCGGETALPSGERFVRCEFCDATLDVERAAVVARYVVPRLLDAAEARAALGRWMSGNETVKDLDTKSRVVSLVPVAFPVWLFRVRAGGTAAARIEPAAPTPIPELADLELPAGQLETYREHEAGVEVIDPVVPLETARGWLEQSGSVDVTETALVDVPLWHGRYEYEGESFQALVDGSTGRVFAAVFPEKSESPYVLVAVLGVVVFGILGLLIQHPVAKLFAYVVAAVPLALVAWWVTRKV